MSASSAGLTTATEEERAADLEQRSQLIEWRRREAEYLVPRQATLPCVRCEICSSAMGELILIRHGETAWSRTGQHAGRTDLPLTEAGEAAARALAPRLAGREFVAVYSSPLTRAVRTADLAGLSRAETDADLIEWNYGRYEGLTAEQIQELKPGWELWRDGVDAGEDLGHVTVRVDAFLGRVRPLLDRGDVAVVAHGHLSRILTARWLGLDASGARQFGHPHPGTINTLGYEHGLPVVLGWNVP